MENALARKKKRRDSRQRSHRQVQLSRGIAAVNFRISATRARALREHNGGFFKGEGGREKEECDEGLLMKVKSVVCRRAREAGSVNYCKLPSAQADAAVRVKTEESERKRERKVKRSRVSAVIHFFREGIRAMSRLSNCARQ